MERKRSSRRRHASSLPPENKCKTCCRRFTAFLFSHVGLCALVVGYSILGAFAFRALEAPYEVEKASQVILMRERTVRRLWEITDRFNVLYRENWTTAVSSEIMDFQGRLIAAVKDGYDGKEIGTGQQWSFSGAFLYSLTVITTIGYGNIAPRTNWGKIVTILYAIVGIPLMLLYLTNIGDILAKAFRYVYGKLCTCSPAQHSQRRRRQAPQPLPLHNHLQRCNSENYRVHHIVGHNSVDLQDNKLRDDQVRVESLADDEAYEGGSKPRVSVPITLCFVIMIGYISGGAAIFSLWEGWEFLDGSYFCFVTLSTIGFGDLVPGDTVVSDSGSQEKLVICSLYLLVGMALIAMCFNLMQEEVIYKVRNCGKRIGIIKDADDDENFS
ncbi:unnamed protein product [Ixodes hexagonus]